MSHCKRVAVYCRTAHEDDFAIGRQAEIVRNYAKKHGYDTLSLALYADNGASGLVLDRPAFNRLKRHIAEGRRNAVIVSEMSRVSRNTFDVLAWINRLQQCGVSFVSVEDGISDDVIERKGDLFQRLREYLARQENLT